MNVMSGFSHATTMDDEIYIAGLRSVGCTQLFRQPYKMVNLQVSAYTLGIGSDFRCSRSNSTGTSGGTMFSTCPRGNSNLTLGCDWVIHSNDFKNRHICGWETNKINASCSLFPLSHSKYSLTHSLTPILITNCCCTSTASPTQQLSRRFPVSMVTRYNPSPEILSPRCSSLGPVTFKRRRLFHKWLVVPGGSCV